MCYRDLYFGSNTLFSLLIGTLQYLKPQRLRAVNIRTFFQIWHESKDVLKMVQQLKGVKDKKVLEDRIKIIQYNLVKLAIDTWRIKKSEIDKWMLDGVLSEDDRKYFYAKLPQ